MDEEEVVIETVLRRKWDTTGIALLGAGFGAVVQGSNEIHHNLIAPSGVQEPIASVLAQVAAGTLAGTFLFTAVSAVHNLIGLKQGRSTPAVSLPYHKSDFAFTGAILAIPLVLAHEIFNFLLGRWRVEFLESADPFSHIVWQIILAALGSELLFRAVAKIRRWGQPQASWTDPPGIGHGGGTAGSCQPLYKAIILARDGSRRNRQA